MKVISLTSVLETYAAIVVLLYLTERYLMERHPNRTVIPRNGALFCAGIVVGHAFVSALTQ